MNKFAGTLLLIAAAFVTHRYFYEPSNSNSRQAALTLGENIARDINQDLRDQGFGGIHEVHHTRVRYSSKSAQQELGEDFLNRNQTKGNIWIEVEFLDLPDDKTSGIITQTSVFDMKTDNKIAEFARSYKVKNPPRANSKDEAQK